MATNRRLVLNLTAIVIGMSLLTAASVPLYRLFCRVTGYGGTTQVSDAAPDHILDRVMTVRFNADHEAGLPWEFFPDQREIKVRLGERTLVSYTARNLENKAVTGNATYNVLPNMAGSYFAKIECFCFQEQLLGPKQQAHMPISFYIDPALASDPAMDGVHTITLSYTFFRVENHPR